MGLISKTDQSGGWQRLPLLYCCGVNYGIAPMTRFQIRHKIAAQLGYVPADQGTIARQNQLALADEILNRPRIARRYEAAALLLCYKAAKAEADAARAALQVAAAACGRARKPDAPIDRVFMRASCDRLMFWAQGKNTPV